MAINGIMIFLLKKALSTSRIARRTLLFDNAHKRISVSQITVAIPMLIIYELSIFLSVFVEKKRLKNG